MSGDNTDRIMTDLQRLLDADDPPIFFNGNAYKRRKSQSAAGRRLIQVRDVVLLDADHVPYLVNAILDAGTQDHRFVLTSEAFIGTRGADLILSRVVLAARLQEVYRPARKQSQNHLTLMAPESAQATESLPAPAPPPARERSIDLS